VQNKVLEAMAMARPVVASPQAAEGIRARAGREFVLAADEAEFAAAVLAQMQSRDTAMGEAARARILTHYDWDRNLSVVDGLFETAPRPVESTPGQPGLDSMENRYA
jgi:glycosyltransferase involved in cell wall biosynthesis